MVEVLKSVSVQRLVCAALLCLPVNFALAQTATGKIGIFDGRADIGEAVIPGVARYDAAAKTDVYVVPAQGGEEKRLTNAAINDGPDFGPDGSIYFSSDRSGSMQVWRMKADGSQAEQMTKDAGNDWFPHVAPNGKQMVYLNRAGSAPVGDATLRLMDLGNGQARVLVDVFGGDGTLNAPSWSSDNHHFAFTEYDMLPRSADGPAYVMVPPRPDVPVRK